MADMLNHKRPPETYWTFDDDLNAFTITATKDFKAGEQVYDSYGRKCNTEFFMNYGFVAADNQYNECQMVLRMPNDPLYHDKLRLLGRDNRKLQFPRDYDNDSAQEAISFLRLAVATEAELHKLTGGSAYYRPNTKKIRPFNLRNEVEMIKLLASAARECLANFSTTLDEDRKLLEEPCTLSRNVQNCIQVRMCEKEVAHHFLSFETVLLPILDGKATNREAQDALRGASAIQSSKHFRHYVNTCILPLLEVNEESDTIGTLIERFAKMSVASPSLDYEDDDDDSLDPLDHTSLE
jgi:histone-lysine N-methyltransferase SETD3